MPCAYDRSFKSDSFSGDLCGAIHLCAFDGPRLGLSQARKPAAAIPKRRLKREEQSREGRPPRFGKPSSQTANRKKRTLFARVCTLRAILRVFTL
jgi:hypothetical protein